MGPLEGQGGTYSSLHTLGMVGAHLASLRLDEVSGMEPRVRKWQMTSGASKEEVGVGREEGRSQKEEVRDIVVVSLTPPLWATEV